MNVNLILWLSIIWIVPLMYFMLANEATFKKNIVIGVTLPFEGREDGEVMACLRKFKKRLGVLCVLLVAVAVPCAFVKKYPSAMTLWLVWLDLAIVLPYIPYVLCNRELKAIKARRGWRKQEPAVITVDTGAMEAPRWLSVWWFVPAVAVSLLPLLWETTLWALYVVNAVCVVLFWFGYRYAYRNKAERVDDDRDLTAVLTRVRRYNWGKMWLIAAWFMPLMGLGMSLTLEHPRVSTLIMVLLTAGLVGAALHIEFSLRRIQEKLTAQSGQNWYVDEDDLWPGGMFYYNPNDSRLLINSRVGMNSTVNIAKRSGQILIGLTALLLVLLPFTGVLLGAGGGQSMDLTVTETTLTASHGLREYVVERQDIADVELLEELPRGLRRTMGTGMPNLLKGNFAAPELGAVNVCLDPTCPPFLLIEEDGGRQYLLGSREEGLVEQVYEELK